MLVPSERYLERIRTIEEKVEASLREAGMSFERGGVVVCRNRKKAYISFFVKTNGKRIAVLVRLHRTVRLHEVVELMAMPAHGVVLVVPNRPMPEHVIEIARKHGIEVCRPEGVPDAVRRLASEQ